MKMTPRQKFKVGRALVIVAFVILCLGHGLGYTVFAPPAGQLPPPLQALVDLAVIRELVGHAATPILGSLWLLSAALGVAAMVTARWPEPSERIEKWFWISVAGIFGLWGGAYIGGALVVLRRSWVFGVFYFSVAFIAIGAWLLVGLARTLTVTVERLAVFRQITGEDPPL